MMNPDRRDRLVTSFLDAWNSQDVERVLDRYTDDLDYRDPNTRGPVTTRDAMRRYLTRLFTDWQMTWTAREVFDLAGEQDGVALLWRATFRRRRDAPSDQGAEAVVVTIDGMDLVVLRGDRVARNEVRFDRTPLEALAVAARR